MTEIALISLDGLDPRTIYDNEDRLPNIKEVNNTGMHGIWSTPGHTIPSYISTLTGRQYNVINFHWDEGRGDYQQHRQVKHEFMWNTIDKSMTLLNIPVLYPPEDIDDVMVCGFLTPDSLVRTNLAKPDSLQEKLNDRDYTHDIHADRTYNNLGGEGMLEYLYEIMWERLELAEELLEEYNSDLFYSVWTSTDRWFHQCTKHEENFMQMYKEVDSMVGQLIDILPDDIPIIFFSDHGFAHYPQDKGVHKGHMYDGWYSIYWDKMPDFRNDSASIFDLYPTVLNWLGEDVPIDLKGRTLFNREDQDKQVESRLRDLGYLE